MLEGCQLRSVGFTEAKASNTPWRIEWQTHIWVITTWQSCCNPNHAQARADSSSAVQVLQQQSLLLWAHLSSSEVRLLDCRGRKNEAAAAPLPSGDMSPESARSSSAAARLDSRRRSVASRPAYHIGRACDMNTVNLLFCMTM